MNDRFDPWFESMEVLDNVTIVFHFSKFLDEFSHTFRGEGRETNDLEEAVKWFVMIPDLFEIEYKPAPYPTTSFLHSLAWDEDYK